MSATATDVQVAIGSLVPEDRVCFVGDWELFEALVEALERQRVRVAFDGARIELMSPSQDHDLTTMRASYLVPMIAGVLGIFCQAIVSTTQKRPPSRGVEPDTSFYLTRQKAEAAAVRSRVRKLDASAPAGPVPDLAIEIDASPTALDRSSIYATLGIPEVWRYDGERSVMERLTTEGRYEPVSESVWLEIRPDELTSLLADDCLDTNEFMDHVLIFAREVLLPRRQARQA